MPVATTEDEAKRRKPRPVDRLLSTAKVARILDISEEKVRGLIKSGELPGKRRTQAGRGGVPRYACLQSAVDEYMVSLPDVAAAQKTERTTKTRPQRQNIRKASGVIQFV